MDSQAKQDKCSLVQLLPDQISTNWGLIKPAVRMSMPPYIKGSEQSMNNILQSLLEGKMRMWTLLKGNSIQSMLITSMSLDEASGTKSLVIYALFSYRKIPVETYNIALNTLRRFAKANECNKIIGFTKAQPAIELAKAMGADLSTLVTLEV